MLGWQERIGIPVELRADGRFLCSRDAFTRWARGRRQPRMEFFYREMRRRTGLLMEAGGVPAGGRWNFDADNRKRLPTTDDRSPLPRRFAPDPLTREVLALVDAQFGHHFGDAAPFWFAVTAGEAEEAFERFVIDALPRFGDYQDAMKTGEPFLYHSVVSLYINTGLLDPLAVCRRVEDAWRRGLVPLNAAEGFIRQIIGWREYVRGIY
jgi:deoxyribodipyrimidine photolyase-related protein